MRAVFVGAGTATLTAARNLLNRAHEVVIIEREKANVDRISQELDCGLILGDGSKPAILREADPHQTDVLFCLTGSDQTNIIASLVGRSLGFKRVITKIDDPEFEHICLELGLDDTIIPARTIGRYLTDIFEGRDPLEITTMIRDDARAFSFVVRDEQAGPLADLELPEDTRVVCIYRSKRMIYPEPETALKARDEVVLITHRDSLDDLKSLLAPPLPNGTAE